jgi:hypothetical protein
MDAEAREHFADMGPEILALAEQLAGEVAPPVWDRIGRLTVLVDDHSGDRMREEIDAQTARTLAHFPGLAPAWWVVFAHVLNEIQPPCVGPRGVLRSHCQMPPLEEPA